MTSDDLVSVTFIVLCHDSADRTLSLVTQLLEEDLTCRVIVHWDKKSARAMFQQLADHLDQKPRCHLMRNRVRCGWGKWGLVEAPLRALRHALNQEEVTDYFYLLSEYCRPVRPLKELREFLTANQGKDFIECGSSDWIKDGIREDRYLYRHYLDKKKHPKLHRWMYRIQKKIGLKRRKPKTYEVRFGSQWWCLSEKTIRKVLNEEYDNPEFKILRLAWIPDECYFQSIVFFLSPKSVSNYKITYTIFDKFGKASTIRRHEVDNYNCFFYRKVG